MSDETRANATVFDYLRWRGDLTLAQDGFNEVDSLILCIISYINLKKLRQLWSFDPKDAMPMGDVCRQLTEEDEQLGLSTLDYIPLMRAAAETARFRDVSLFAFESLHDEAQQIVRRHMVIVAHPGHEGQARLPDAVFIVAQQRLADAQLRRRLPLGHALLLPQQAQGAGKISCHSLTYLFSIQ